MNTKTFCNTSLPANALNVVDVEEGMLIRFAFDGTGTHTVVRVAYGYNCVWLFTDKGQRRCNRAGTVRLVGVSNYNYHTGHNCIKDN